MAGLVRHKLDLQEAIPAMEEKIVADQVATALPIAKQLNATIREHVEQTPMRPSYDLVGTIPVLNR